MMMRALVFYGPHDIRLEKCEVPQIGEGELLVRVKAAGVCGTDVRIFNGTKKIVAPRIIGHEFAGDVVEVGKGADSFVAGDRVTVYPSIACGNCYACRAGRTNICVSRSTLGYEVDGGFADFVKIPAAAVKNKNVSKLPNNVSYEEGAISEPLTAAYNGIRRAAIQPGDTVLIIGAGPIGLLHTQLAREQGAGLVIVVEPQALKREKAIALGARVTIDPISENVAERIGKLTEGTGVDVAIVDVGIPKIVEESMSYVKKGGIYIIFAGCPEGSTITIDPNLIHYRELVVTGSSASTPEHQRTMLQWISAGKIDMKAIVSDSFPMEQWWEAFNMKEKYIGLKTVLTF